MYVDIYRDLLSYWWIDICILKWLKINKGFMNGYKYFEYYIFVEYNF